MIRLAFFLCLLSLAPARNLIGDLITKKNNVSGTLYALNTRTLRLENFYYDGKSENAVFWVNNVTTPNTVGRIPFFRDTCKQDESIRKYNGEVVEFELAPDYTIDNIGYFSVWDTQAKAQLGGLQIDPSALENLLVLQNPTCPLRTQLTITRVFPVERGWNCLPLDGNYQVRWKLDSNRTKIDFELVARLRNGDQWMAFGPGGSSFENQMIGSDVAVAYRRDTEFFAVDYHLHAQRPCEPRTGEGVCPDTVRDELNGADDVTDVSGAFKEEITLVRYSRPVKGNNADLDLDIVVDGPAVVSWAYGPLKVENLFPLFHNEPLTFPKKGTTPVMIEFGREPRNDCSPEIQTPIPTSAADPQVPGFERPVLYNVGDITARIGPSGGVRGVSAITESASLTIAWYLSETGSEDEDVLIPALGVQRGKTYTFRVFGGIPTIEDDPTVHPFYITSSPVGGYLGRTPKQRAEERVYAGITNIEKNRGGGVISFRATATGALCKFETSVTDTSAVESYDDFFDTFNTSCTEDPVINANGGKLVWKVAENTPNIVYYQSATSDNMGYKIRVFSGKVDVAQLQEISGGGPLPLEEGPDVSCVADFKGVRRPFRGCSRGLGGIVDVFWNVNETSGEIETLFRAPKNNNVGYVGLGWGFSRMIGSSAVIAYELDANNAGIGDYFLEARDPTGVQPNNMQKLITAAVDNSGAFLRGLFTRDLEVDGLPPLSVGGTERTDLIWAVGVRPGSPTSLSTHRRRGRGSVRLDVGEQTPAESRDLDSVFIVHAVFMGITWLLLVPIAITAMRFFKKYNPITFNVHRVINYLAGILTIAGFIMAIVSGSRTETAHLAIGSIVFSLVIVQVLLGTIRPHKDRPWRTGWFWVHAILGSLLSGLGIANCFVGIGTQKIGGPVGWYVAAGVAAGLYVGLQVVFAFMPNTFPRTDEEEDKARLREERTRSAGRTFVRDD